MTKNNVFKHLNRFLNGMLFLGVAGIIGIAIITAIENGLGSIVFGFIGVVCASYIIGMVIESVKDGND